MSRTREGVDQFSEYTEEETGRGWRKLRRRLEGYEFLVYGSKTDDYIKAINAAGVELKLNDMSDRIELMDGRPLNDFQAAAILNRLRDYDMKDVARMKDALKEAALRNKYHPVRDYLDSLEWDGQNHFDALMGKLTMSSPIADVFWRKWLIGSIAKMLNAQQNYMLVLLGGQGTGKSRLVEWLCPLPHLFYEGAINPDDKDSLIRLINNWIWEVAELDSTTKRSERSALKHFITTRIVKVRVPFGHYDTEKPAAASMIGTVNADGTGFLNDPTGNRRFAVIHLDSIDWSYTGLDKAQLWAEIYAAYKNGETWELTPHEQEIQNEINGGHMMISPLEELLGQYYEIDPSDAEHFTPTMEILERLGTLGLKGDQFKQKMELATILTKHGLKPFVKRIGQKTMRGYRGVWYRGEAISVEKGIDF
jgi:predicted P-loop ATPase